jgi:hypothetical protein
MRQAYFAFHYADIFRVNQVRNSGLLFGARSVGFADASLWEKARTVGTKAIQRIILDGLEGTSVTVVLIGEHTADRPWVKYEIEQSHGRGNALVGVRIHHLKGPHVSSNAGRIPDLLQQIGTPIYSWTNDSHALGTWIEQAIVARKR